MGAVSGARRRSGVFADEHEASVTSVTTRVTTNHPRKITGRPYVQRHLNLANAERTLRQGSRRGLLGPTSPASLQGVSVSHAAWGTGAEHRLQCVHSARSLCSVWRVMSKSALTDRS
jgi:hypothetical protein